MSNLEFILQQGRVDIIIELIRLCIIVLGAYFIFIKIINLNKISIKNVIASVLSAIVISIITTEVKYRLNSYFSILILICLATGINFINYKKDILYTVLVTIISLGINYVVYGIAIAITFFPNAILKVDNDYMTLAVIITIYLIAMYIVFKMRKIKYGIVFLQKKLENSYFNILILNICTIILFLIMMLQDQAILGGARLGVTFIILAITMFITIKQSFDMYYKQKLLAKDLEETKTELELKNKEVEKLEIENLEFSKTSHSLAHRQKALEYKVNQLMKLSNEDVENKDYIKNELESISKEVYKEPQDITLPQTDIISIDNMLEFMQSECIKNNIKFDLQIEGNIHYIINNYISEKDLEILIADHVKDAIIAVNHTDSSNRNILVRLGKIEQVYSLYIYDTGIEFEEEILKNLGKKAITTYLEEGGTGMGFMNTFDTLNKTKASLIINEIGPVSTDNYTKVIIIKFDNKNEFKINSYKKQVCVIK